MKCLSRFCALAVLVCIIAGCGSRVTSPGPQKFSTGGSRTSETYDPPPASPDGW